MPKYMMLLRDEGADFSQYTAHQFEELLGGYSKWTKDLSSKGYLIAGEKLKDDGGKTLRSLKGDTTTHGQYSSKAAETIGGFYLITAGDYDEALKLGRGCPTLSYGGSVEVREIESME